MDSLTLADAFWSALVLAGSAALVLDGAARSGPARRAGRRPVAARPVAARSVDRTDEGLRTATSP